MCGKYHISTEDENLDFREAVARLMLAHPGTDIRTGDILPGQIAPVYTARGLAPPALRVQALPYETPADQRPQRDRAGEPDVRPPAAPLARAGAGPGLL